MLLKTDHYNSVKAHSLNSDKVSIQIQLKALPELSEWTLQSTLKY